MGEAFVLINCDLGKENQVVKRLQDMPLVKEAQATVGVYDVIAKLESTSEDLDTVIKSEILPIKPVNRVVKLEFY
ncbi:MAG TPA: Lrp/AsnC ligand binding domain-containing protein [Candidatus Nitrosotalea sp.]|nr:Lrp/AsnC ligand binding domain-containing protein [Candidatus Nitrosotalea sp.]